MSPVVSITHIDVSSQLVSMLKIFILIFILVRGEGIEPPAYSTSKSRSTTELTARGYYEMILHLFLDSFKRQNESAHTEGSFVFF